MSTSANDTSGSNGSNGSALAGANLLADMRLAFDRTFAEAPVPEVGGQEGFLAIRIASDPFAVRVADLSGLYLDRKIVRIPSPARSLLGLVSLRGALLPAHDLRTLLGYPTGGGARWIAVVQTTPRVGLVFDVFEGHFLATTRDNDPQSPGGQSRGRARGLVTASGILRPVLDVAAVRSAIATLPANQPPKEP